MTVISHPVSLLASLRTFAASLRLRLRRWLHSSSASRPVFIESLEPRIQLTVEDTTPPYIIEIVEPGSGYTSPVDGFGITFSEAIDISSFSEDSYTLTRNGELVLPGPSVISFYHGSDTTYYVYGTADMTASWGSYTFTFNDQGVSDPTGNKLEGSSSVSWDTLAATPSTPALAPGSTIYTDNANSKTPTFVGTGSPNAPLEIWIDSNYYASDTVDADGTYEFTVGPLTRGDHDIQIRSVYTIDGAPYETDFTPVYYFSIPLPVIAATQTISSPTPNPVSSIWFEFTEGVNPSTFSWESVSLTRDGGADLITESTPVTFGHVSGTTYAVGGLGDLTNDFGNYTFTFHEGGVAGDGVNRLLDNESTVQWIKVADVPSLPALAPASTYAGNTTNTTKPRFTGTALRNATIEFWVDDVLNNVYTADSTGNYSFETYALSQGEHTVKARSKVTIDGVDYFSDFTSSVDITVNSGKFISITQFPAPQTKPIPFFIINAGAALDLSTFTTDNISLLLEGSPVINRSLMTYTLEAAGAGYAANALKLSFPGEYTSSTGRYFLNIYNSGLKSTAGQDWLDSGSLSTAWTNKATFTFITQPTSPRTTSPTTFIVNSTHPIAPGTSPSLDAYLTRNGNPIGSSTITFAAAGAGYAANAVKITVPAGLTSEPGDYVLSFNQFGTIQPSTGGAFSNNVSTSWTTQARFNAFSGGLTPTRTSPLTSIIINPTHAVDVSSLSDADFTLTREGAPVTVSGLTFAAAGAGYAANAIKVTLPASLTSANGQYLLTLSGAGVTTPAGSTFTGNQTATWNNQAQFTHLTQFTNRTTPVSWLTINPNQPIDLASFTTDDITLNGIAQSLTGVTITLAGPGYAANAIKISLPYALTLPNGDYILTVNGSGINSTYGPAFVNSRSSSWTKT